jgi:hypothetical protein
VDSEGSPEEREPRLARRSPFAPEPKLCPRCLSPLSDVTGDLLGFIPSEYHCRKCGYQGPVYVVDDKDQRKG